MPNKIPDAARQGILDKLLLIGHVPGNTSYHDFVGRVYPESKTIQYNHTALINEVARHCDSFPGDWGDDTGMFSVLRYMEWTDQQILYFCKEYVNPVFSRYEWDEEKGEYINLQPQCVEAINLYLKDCGYELRPAGKIGDKLEYDLVQIDGVQGELRNIIFATKTKPRILFDDALNNKIRVENDSEECLFYDRPISNTGITWADLENWYNDLDRVLSDCSFKDRLRYSLDSVPEQLFYDTYVEFAEEHNGNVPALFPQVWLYYDPVLGRDRIKKIYEHQRMDFMMLFSCSQRVVIEIDGKQHYSDENGQASVDKYAKMVAAHREMTLAGYDVYRFGGKELQDEGIGKRLVKKFLNQLLEKYCWNG